MRAPAPPVRIAAARLPGAQRHAFKYLTRAQIRQKRARAAHHPRCVSRLHLGTLARDGTPSRLRAASDACPPRCQHHPPEHRYARPDRSRPDCNSDHRCPARRHFHRTIAPPCVRCAACAASRCNAFPRCPDLMHRTARPATCAAAGACASRNRSTRTSATNGRAPVIRYNRERHYDEHAA